MPLTMRHEAPLRLDLASGEVRCGQVRVRLRRKSFDVLRYLAERQGRLVTKGELLDAVWPDTFVSDGVLKVCVAELRKALRTALGERGSAAELLVTLHGRGYRLDLPGGAEPPAHAPSPLSSSSAPPPPSAALGEAATASFVGRAAESAQLRQALGVAAQGERQIVFVTGEAGIGKTTLVEAFLDALAHEPAREWAVGRGQCVQRYGIGEALMPLLEALGRLCRGPHGARLTATLSRRAPLWVAEVLDLTADDGAARRPSPAATLGGMLRVLVEALEAASAEAPLLLVIEDLHWADPSTVDFISTLAERRERAHLLLLGTYRDAEVQAAGQALRSAKSHLHLHRRCTELRLAPLGEDAIGAYLERQLGGAPAPAGLAHFLGRWTEGNPLFLASLFDYLKADGVLARDAGGWRLTADLAALGPRVPETVQELIERQLAQLDAPVQRVLEVASVAGFAFTSQTLDVEPVEPGAEAVCDELVRRGQFLRAEGAVEWPDGTLGTRYAFIHSLYQVTLYERLGAGRRRELHQRLGERLEAGFGVHADEIAAELAAHYERSRDARRALHYLAAAAGHARRRAAPREAVVYLDRQRALYPRLPDTPERAEHELATLITLAGLRMITEGTTSEVGAEYARALELCSARDSPERRFVALAGLHAFCLNTAQLERACAVGAEMLALAEAGVPGAFRAAGLTALGMAEYPLGDLLTARTHLEQALDESAGSPTPLILDFVDVRILSLGALAQVHAHSGEPARAFERCRQARAIAAQLNTPFSLFAALYHEAGVHQILDDWCAVLALIDEQLRLLAEHGFQFFVDKIAVMRGWALVQAGRVDDGLVSLEEGLRACESKEQGLARPHFLALLARACIAAGDVPRAQALLATAFDVLAATGERRYESDLHRLQADLLLAAAAATPEAPCPGAEARAAYERALAAARRQSARTSELRAALALARLHVRQSCPDEARRLLDPLVARFTDGIVTADLAAAQALLAGLSAPQSN